MNATTRLAQLELELADEIAQCFADPLRFVRFAFPWGKGELEGEDGPDTWQIEVLQAIGKGVLTIAQAMDRAQEYEAMRAATAAGKGVGKSALVAWLILWSMSTRPHVNGIVTANTGAQLEQKTWRELSVWHKRLINQHWFTWTATKFYKNSDPETWFFAAVLWNEQKPEAFAGQHGRYVVVIMDEASGIPDIIWETAEGAQTTGEVQWYAFGNTTRPTGRFRECFGRFRHRWQVWQIDSRTCKKANKHQAAQWVQDYGEDSDFVRMNVRGVFPRAGSTQFIDDELVREAQKREVIPDEGAPLIMGVDVARFGEDQSVIRYRQGRDARSIKPKKYRGIDTMNLASIVVEEFIEREVDMLFIDGNGVGGGVVDRVLQLLSREQRKKVIEVQNGSKARNDRDYHNKRAECWALYKAWLKTGCIDDDQQLYDDSVGPLYAFDGDNRIQLERKQDMKKRGLASPDDGDSLAQTFASTVGRRDVQTVKPKVKVAYARGMRASGGSAWQT